MVILILIFGVFFTVAGVLLMINPRMIFAWLSNNVDNLVVHVIAVIVRLVLGYLLIRQAPISRFPAVIEVLGWIFVLAALSLAVLGRVRFQRLLSWVLERFAEFGRVAGIVSILFGGFLVYAFS